MRKAVLAVLAAAVLGACGHEVPTEVEQMLPPVVIRPDVAHFPVPNVAQLGSGVVFTASGGDSATYHFIIPGNDTLAKPIFRLQAEGSNGVRVTRLNPNAGGQMILHVESLSARSANAVLHID